jgi:DNA-binding transcriptional LysR family regulator
VDPLAKLGAIWNWLPVFQAVGETEHLPTAARRLHVTASGLSRTIRMLEDSLGETLFERTGRAIRLNTNGRRLLGFVQRATETLSAGVVTLSSAAVPHPVNVTATGALAQAVVAPALRDLCERDASILPHLNADIASDLEALLRAGRLDVGFSPAAVRGPGLESALLGEASVDVYCGRSHPLFGRANVSPREICAHAFVCCASAGEGDALAGSGACSVAMVVNQVQVAVQLCAEGRLLCMLPEPAARALVSAGALFRLPFPGLPRRGST